MRRAKNILVVSNTEEEFPFTGESVKGNYKIEKNDFALVWLKFLINLYFSRS